MKHIILLAAIAATGGCATMQDRPLEVAWQAAHVVDVVQTMELMKRPCVREGHPLTRAIIGDKPSQGEILGWGIGGAVIHLAVSDYLLSKDWKVAHGIWQAVSLTDTGIAIGKNIKVEKRGCQ